ncbi:putative MFS family arabinose efflux permease [Kribbella sp. VKM Ac-2569]|uniref:MFS transporter n=1 Tax=Kribbella sp. VKM Ac-2569 TaxID=2512220 RepID=UPI00102AA2CE|nr:MFS transporter [Kribbella sp. VKM Ac-2569]RZT20888.1 putative MFS family arabinose efflux permease [Kribbella sp. VKM Ac-2569]
MKQTLQTSIWSSRDIRLVLPARALSYAGDSIAMIALMLRVSDGHGPAAVTALLLAFAVPTVVMIPFAGRIVDGFDSRTVLVWSGLLQVVAGIGLAFVHDLVNTLALVCVLQIGQAVAGPAWGALIPRIVGEELVGRTTGTSQALIGVATLAGSAAGGVLVGWVGSRGALLVDAATFLALVVIAQLVRTRRRPEPGAARERGGVSAGLRSIFGDDILKILVPALWMFVVAGEAVNVVEVFLITGELGLGPALYGAAGAATGAGAIFGAWYSGRLNGDRARAVGVVVGMAAIGGSSVLMGLAGNLVTLLIGATTIGVGSGMLNAATSALVVTRSAEAVRGRVIAALNGTVRSFSILAMLLGGLAGALLGPRGTFVTCGVACVVAAAIVGALVARSKDESKDSELEALSH